MIKEILVYVVIPTMVGTISGATLVAFLLYIFD